MDPRIESECRRCCEREDWTAATTVLLEGYGPNVLGYLAARTGNSVEAEEVFALWCEDLWRGIRGFRWEASARTWAYRIAHNARVRHAKRGAPPQYVPLSDAPELLALAAEVRTETARHLRTETKDSVAKLRASLNEDDRSLLILRVDRGLSWAEIADVHGEDASRAPTYRKRFERAKARLTKLAAEAGLL